MAGLSMSVSAGPVGGHRHNVESEYREGLAHVDRSRTALNTVLVDRELSEVYRERFGTALEAYNERQRERGHPERQIVDYLRHIQRSRQEKPSYECVVQVGDMLTNPATDPYCRELSEQIYRDFLEQVRVTFPYLEVVRAAIHMDEATPHLHVEYVPVSEGNRRGLETKNSLRGALRMMGMTDVRELNSRMFEVLEAVAREHGVERVDMGCKGRKHMDPRTFREYVRAEAQKGYPYENDPRLVAASQGIFAECVVVNESITEMRAFIEDVRDHASNPLHGRRLAQRAAEVLESTEPARSTFERLLEAVRDALAGIPCVWRDYLINPVSEALRAARAALGELLEAQAAGSRNETLSETNDRLAPIQEAYEQSRAERRAAWRAARGKEK